MKKLVGVVALLLVLSAAQSQAATIGSTPANNDVIGVTEGWFGASLYLIAGPGGALIDIDFVGKEAAFTNRFFLNGTEYINNQTTAVTVPNPNAAPFVAPVATVLVAPGLITFHFSVNGVVGPTNGSNPLPTSPLPNYFVTLGGLLDTTVNGITPGSGTTAWIALDDGGAGPDDNHDDLVVRLRISGGTFQAPDGGVTLTLLGFALIGLGALRSRLGA